MSLAYQTSTRPACQAAKSDAGASFTGRWLLCFQHPASGGGDCLKETYDLVPITSRARPRIRLRVVPDSPTVSSDAGSQPVQPAAAARSLDVRRIKSR